MIDDTRFCSFYLDDMVFGVHAIEVQEIIRYQQVTRVPLAKATVAGMINLRGQIVVVLDLRRRLGLPPLDTDTPPMNVVVRTDDGAFSLLVDRIGDVIDVDATQHERPPENVSAAARELIVGTYKLPDRLLMVLDTSRTVRTALDGAGDSL
jgi:purine-binding chemotaxis protein CheW